MALYTDGIEEVVMFKVENGKLFPTREEAEKGIRKNELMEKIDNDIYCRDTNVEEIANWIEDNLIYTFK